MPYNKRDETQRFTSTYSDEEFLDAVRELEVAGTSEVGEKVGCTTENARVRLDDLAERDELVKRKIGGRNAYLLTE